MKCIYSKWNLNANFVKKIYCIAFYLCNRECCTSSIHLRNSHGFFVEGPAPLIASQTSVSGFANTLQCSFIPSIWHHLTVQLSFFFSSALFLPLSWRRLAQKCLSVFNQIFLMAYRKVLLMAPSFNLCDFLHVFIAYNVIFAVSQSQSLVKSFFFFCFWPRQASPGLASRSVSSFRSRFL